MSEAVSTERQTGYLYRWYVLSVLVIVMWIPGIATLAALPFSLFAYLWNEPYVALWGLVIPYILGAYWLAPTFSMTQGLAGLRMRSLPGYSCS